MRAHLPELQELVVDWREQAVAEEHCQRSGGNPKGAAAYRHCADDLEEILATIGQVTSAGYLARPTYEE